MKKFDLATDAARFHRLESIGVGELRTRVTPGATDVARAQFAAGQQLWLFAFDDAFCDEGLYRSAPAAAGDLPHRRGGSGSRSGRRAPVPDRAVLRLPRSA
ncbi:hypothetical protein ACFRAR_11515 [Kitasatospora sp. NPDC056651]|uniref:hypothetical protein n=1 Tax=Kitasatospora sp. NPDC056651 TaxID=3345892 RepID=UPI00369EEB41